jgi:hypothetical protein
MGSPFQHGQLRARDQFGDLLRLPHRHEQVVLRADHVRGHVKRAETGTGVVASAGVELAHERLGWLRVGCLEHHPAQPADLLGVLEELLGEAQQHQLVDALLERHPADALGPDLAELARPGAAAGEAHRDRQGADALGSGDRHLLRDRAAHRHAQQVEAVELQRIRERERVGGHV